MLQNTRKFLKIFWGGKPPRPPITFLIPRFLYSLDYLIFLHLQCNLYHFRKDLSRTTKSMLSAHADFDSEDTKLTKNLRKCFVFSKNFLGGRPPRPPFLSLLT